MFRGNGAPRRIGAWLGLLAIFATILIPLGQAIPAENSPLGIGGYLIVCTGLGIKAIPVDDGNGKSGDESRSVCPICQITALGKSLVAPADTSVPMPLSRHMVALPSLVSGVTAAGVILAPRVRAPPHAA
ncbi:MAG: DUF2946 domain-containing protein [Rhodospirillales bacterium]|nr:DUF2946 domain-containing protein [Rhodospirillales bacterium]